MRYYPTPSPGREHLPPCSHLYAGGTGWWPERQCREHRRRGNTPFRVPELRPWSTWEPGNPAPWRIRRFGPRRRRVFDVPFDPWIRQGADNPGWKNRIARAVARAENREVDIPAPLPVAWVWGLEGTGRNTPPGSVDYPPRNTPFGSMS